MVFTTISLVDIAYRFGNLSYCVSRSNSGMRNHLLRLRGKPTMEEEGKTYQGFLSGPVLKRWV